MVAVVQLEDALDPRHRVVDHIVEPFGTVADFGDRHAGTGKIEKRFLNGFEDRQGQGGRASVEIKNSVRFHRE